MAGRSSGWPRAYDNNRKTQTKSQPWTRSSKRPGQRPTRKSRRRAFARRRNRRVVACAVPQRSEMIPLRQRTLQQRRLLRFGWSDARELLHQLIQLRDVVVDVFVAVLRIEVTRELGSLISGALLRRSFDVVADLFARFVVATAR